MEETTPFQLVEHNNQQILTTAHMAVASGTDTLGNTLRQRAFANEDNVPNGFFAVQIEFGRELYYWERTLNARLDSSAQVEISVGKCWWDHARSVLQMQSAQRCQYPHQCSNGHLVNAWAYPLCYLPDFRQWLREIYFVEKLPAYRHARAKRIGTPTVSARTVRTQLQLARSGVTQLLLFSRAIE
jgi:hypothetical protein